MSKVHICNRYTYSHTKDKKGNDIDKLACSEFWKEKDSYRQLQNAFYDYMVSHEF